MMHGSTKLKKKVQVNLTLNKRKTLVGGAKRKRKGYTGGREGAAEQRWHGLGWNRLAYINSCFSEFSELCRVPSNNATACDEELGTMRKTATAGKVTTALVQRD